MYTNHADIPTAYRRVILEETLLKRVSKVPLPLCNEIIENYLEDQAENNTLKYYQIEFIKEGKHGIVEIEGRQSTLVQLDRILEYGENKDPKVVIAVRQNGRLVSSYINCEWSYPQPKDKLLVRSAA